MAKNKKNIIDQIRKEIELEPVEDVYEKYFSGKESNEELLETFLKSFDTENINVSEFKSIKINGIKNWVEKEYDESNEIFWFPHFIDYYISRNYKEDGLKSHGYYHGIDIIVLDRHPEEDDDLEDFIKEFEDNLLLKSWWGDYETEVWSDLQRKRRIVEDFEDYIYELESEIFEIGLEDRETFIANYKIVYQKHIDRIKLDIAKCRLFKENLEKVPVLENLINYLDALVKDESYYWDVAKELEGSQERAEQTLKLNLMHQFGIIKYLNQIWGEYNIPKALEFLISTLINEKHTSIQPRLSNSNDPKLRNPTSIKKLENYLKEFGLDLDQIK